LHKPQRLLEETKENWQEITEMNYQFGRKQKEVEEVKKITKDQLLNFFVKKVVDKSERRKISFQVFGNQSVIPIQNSPDHVIILKGEEHIFKSRMGLYPLK